MRLPYSTGIDGIQVFRKVSHEAIELISALLEYTPTQRLSAIEAMCHPFFDELRDPNIRLPDSRLTIHLELSIAPELNHRLVPAHARAALQAKGLDIDNFKPLTKDQMMARLD